MHSSVVPLVLPTIAAVERGRAIFKWSAGAVLLQCGPTISAPVRLHELENRLRNVAEFSVASPQFIGDIHGCISAPAFSAIEGDDADGVVELALDQITDQRLAISGVFDGLAPRSSEPTKVTRHEASTRGTWLFAESGPWPTVQPTDTASRRPQRVHTHTQTYDAKSGSGLRRTGAIGALSRRLVGRNKPSRLRLRLSVRKVTIRGMTAVRLAAR